MRGLGVYHEEDVEDFYSITLTGAIIGGIEYGTIVSAEGETAQNLPSRSVLHHAYPNPFNPSTTIRYGLPSRSHVTLTVFNTLGQQVATLVQGEQEAGFHEAVFGASGLASGVYLCRLTAGSHVLTQKMICIR
jgi:hypothetical protein